MTSPLRMRFELAISIFLLAAAMNANAISRLAPPSNLTCDHQVSPLAITSLRPGLAWKLNASDDRLRGVRQTAWRVLVSSTMDKLQHDQGDLWDSGRVSSNLTVGIPYGGKALAPEQDVFWKVEAWDDRGTPSGWSTPARFIMAPAGWSARWIGAHPDSEPEGRDEGASRPMPIFRREFRVGKSLQRAVLYVAGLGQDEVHINGVKVGNRELTPGWTDYRKRILYDTFDVTALLRSGPNVIGVLLGNGMFNVAKTPGRYTKLVGSFGQPQCWAELHLYFRDGTSRMIATDREWQTTSGPVIFSSTYGGEDY